MSERVDGSRTMSIITLLFVGSGASSLGFELVWAKELGIVLGGTTTAIAFVVALFMGGMAIGYGLGGRIAPRAKRPIALYGVAEIVLGVWGAGSVYVPPMLEGVASPLVTQALCLLLLLPSTVLAGMTLPLLVESTRGSVGGAVGRLYGLNTLGAVIGVVATGMFLIGAFGLRETALMLGGLSLFVGLCALWLGRAPLVRLGLSEDGAAESSESKPVVAHDALQGRWLALALFVGCASLAEEVLWTRASIAQLNSSTYAFSAILAVFLLGLALGASVAARLVERGWDPVRLLATTQLAAALFVLTSPEMLVLAERAVWGYVGVREIRSTLGWLMTTWIALARTGFALLLPTTMLGVALPLLAELYSRGRGARAESVARVAGWNTVGGVAGSLGARFVLLPLLGVCGSLSALAALHAVFGAVAIATQVGRARVLFIGLAVLTVVAAIARPNAPPFIGRLARVEHVIFVDEGVQDTTAVVEMRARAGARQIISNGIAYAGDSPDSKRYMRMLGHLPSLLARQQHRALVICLGTGMTAAAIARHPGFSTLDLVDISPVVHRTLPLFSRVNDRVYQDPRARIHIDDGRVFLAHARPGSYDVITLEPPPPRAAGVAALYSREFYLSASRALTDGGVLAQWLPVHGMTEGELRMLARTFVEVFPDATLYEIQYVEAALVAVRGRGASRAEIARRLAVPGVAAQLREVGVTSPTELPSVGGAELRARLGDGPIVTDDLPRIEHFASTLSSNRPRQNTDTAGQGFLDHMLGRRRIPEDPRRHY